MEEHLDVLDKKGAPTEKSLSYKDVHKMGLAHRSVHVWFLNSKRQLLLQKRSKNKIAYPGLWDISGAGHVSSGETSLEAAKKETREELGLDLPDSVFTLLFSIKQPEIIHSETFIDNEFNDVYLVHSDVDSAILKLQIEEVEEVKWVDISTLKEWTKESNEMLVPHKEEYEKLFDYLADNI